MLHGDAPVLLINTVWHSRHTLGWNWKFINNCSFHFDNCRYRVLFIILS